MSEEKKELKEQIEDWIANRKILTIRAELSKLNPVDIAQHIKELEEDDLVFVFRILPKYMAAKVFSYTDIDTKKLIVDNIVDKELTAIIDNLYLDDTVDFIEELPANVVERVLASTNPERRALINHFLQYPEESVGSIMTVEYVSFREDMTVSEAIAHIKKTGIDKETINRCYVLDAERDLKGMVSIRHLILGEDTDLVKDIMTTEYIYTSTLKDQEEVAMLFKKYDLLAIPVVDEENRLVGIVTIDDIVDVIDREATEDMQKMAAMAPSVQQPYLKTNSFKLTQNRIWWLLFLMISATVSGFIIDSYEAVLASNIILASFIPMLMDTGGNAGSQSATLVIRGLALGEIDTKDFFKVLWKEVLVSLMASGVLAIVSFLRIVFISGQPINVGLVVSLTLIVVVVLSKTIGGMLPIVAKTLKLDPAIMAGPLITTIVDTISLLIYFALATAILGIL